jgi:hypothetical protein
MFSRFFGPSRLRVLLFGLAAALGLLPFSVALSGPAVAGPNSETGQKVIINGTQQVPVTPQPSSTQFDFLPPAGAACTGNTATGGYHLYSYVVDASQVPDPGTLTYNSSAPNTGVTLLDFGGNPYANNNTTTTGAFPLPLPTFAWSPGYAGNFGVGLAIYPGTFNVGVACVTTTGTTDKFWNVQMVFTASSSDPNGFTWNLATNAKATTTTLTGSPKSPQPRGVAETLSAHVGLSGGGTPPNNAGSVQFYDQGHLLGTTGLSSGVAIFTVNAPPLGTHSYTAIFQPSDPTAYSASTSGPLSFEVTATGTTSTTTTGGGTTSTTSPAGTSTSTSTSTAAGSGSTGTGSTGSGSGGSGGSGSSGDPSSTGASTSTLAATGSSVFPLLRVAVIALVAGGILIEIARGRLRRPPEEAAGTASPERQ